MKQSLRLFFSLLLTVYGISGIHAQQFAGFPERYFQYQNNGAFNAFFIQDVDSIVYSRLDLDSILHEDVVVEEIWTRDSVYRIPLEVVDSIALYGPETILKEGISFTSGGGTTSTGGNQQALSRRRKSGLDRGESDEPIALIPEQLKLDLLPNGLMTATLEKITLEHDWYLYKDESAGTYTFNFDATLNFPKIEVKTQLSTDVLKSVFEDVNKMMKAVNWAEESEPIFRENKDGVSVKMEAPGIIVLSLYKILDLKLGLAFEFDGSVNFTETATTQGNIHFNFTISGKLNSNIPTDVNVKKENNIAPFEKSYSGEINGSLKAGLTAEIIAKPILKDIAYAKLSTMAGWQMQGKLKFDISSMAENASNSDFATYNLLKDSYLQTNLFMDYKLKFGVLYDLINKTLWEDGGQMFVNKRYIFPELKRPHLLDYVDENGIDRYEPAFTADVSRNVLFPTYLTLGMRDAEGNSYGIQSIQPFTSDFSWKPQNLKLDINGFAPGTKLVCYPGLVLGHPFNTALEFDVPEMQKTIIVPEPISIANLSVNMYPNTQTVVPIKGGWDKLKITKSIEHDRLLDELLISHGDGISRGLVLTSKTPYEGYWDNRSKKIPVYITDQRANKTVTVYVTIANTFNTIPLSADELDLVQGDTATVEILNPQGTYTLKSLYEGEEGPSVVFYGNTLKITAAGLGTYELLIYDETGKNYGRLKINVSDGKSISLSQEELELFVGESAMVYIRRGTGNYRIVNESPDVARGELTDILLQNDVRITANQVGTAKINVQDLNTGDYVTVVVTVKSRQWKYAVDSSGDSFSIGGVNFKMVNVDGGTFTMGATVDDEEDAKNYPNERPAHRVTLSDFQIGETEVTNELWDAVMGKDYGKYARLHEAAFSYNQERFPDDDPLSPQQPMSIEYQYLGSRFDYGVGMILNFIDSLNTLTGKHFRLPTEAEWEYAAKGGPQGHNYMFAGSNDLYDVAQVYRRGIDGYLKTITDSYGRPVVKDGKVQTEYSEDNYNIWRKYDVALKRPNELGLYDMTGNVAEMCSSVGTYTYMAQEDPEAYGNRYYHFYSSGYLVKSKKNIPIIYRGGGGFPYYDPIKDPALFKCRNMYRITGRYEYFKLASAGLRLAMGGPLRLERQEVELGFTKSTEVFIYSGFGDYKAVSKNPEIAVASIDHNMVVISSVSGGKTIVTVTDARGQKAEIAVDIPYNEQFEVREKDLILYLSDRKGHDVGIDGGCGILKIQNSRPDVAEVTYNKSYNRLNIGQLSTGETTIRVTDIASRKTETLHIKVYESAFNIVQESGDNCMDVGEQAVYELKDGSGQFKVQQNKPDIFKTTLEKTTLTITAAKTSLSGNDTIKITDTATGSERRIVVNLKLKMKCKDGFISSEDHIDGLLGERRIINIEQGNGIYTVRNIWGNDFSPVVEGNKVVVNLAKTGNGAFAISEERGNSCSILVNVFEPLEPDAQEVNIVRLEDEHIHITKGSNDYIITDVKGGIEEVFSNKTVWGREGIPSWKLDVVAESRKKGANKVNDNKEIFFKVYKYRYNNYCGIWIRGMIEGNGSITLQDMKTGSKKIIPVHVGLRNLELSDSSIVMTPNAQLGTMILINSGNYSYTLSNSQTEVATAKLINDNYGEEYLDSIPYAVLISPHKAGKTVVTITDNYTNQSKAINVNVYDHLSHPYANDVDKNQLPMLFVGETKDVPLTGSGSYTASTSDAEVATVTVNGNVATVKATGQGWAAITFTDTVLEETGLLFVTVYQALSVSISDLTISTSQTYTVDVTSGSGNYDISVADPSIVRAYFSDGSIKIDPYKAGTTTITITDKATGQTQQINVTVNPSAFAGFSLDKQSLELLVGRPTEVKVIGDAMIDVVSSDESVATIHNFGESFWVYPIAPGECIITVTNKQSLEKIELPVTVYPAIEVDACRESSDEGAYFTAVEQGKTLTIAITKGSGHYQIIYEHESHAGNVRIEGSNVLVTGVNADAQDGIYGFKVLDEKTSAEALVNVRVVPVGQFELKFAEPTMELAIGEEKTINASVKNWMVIDDAINNESVITLESIVTYRDHYDYSIKGLAEGTSTFTLYDKVSRQTAILTVTVRENSTTYPDLQLYKYNVEEAVSTTECVGIVSGSGSYQVESSNDNIAEAKLNWQLVCILAKAPGTATITVTDLKTGQVKTIYVKVHDGQSGQDEIWKSKIADLWYEFDKLREELKEKATEEEAPELYAMLRDIDSYISAMDSDWRNGKFASLEKYETDIKQRLEQLKKAIDALGK